MVLLPLVAFVLLTVAVALKTKHLREAFAISYVVIFLIIALSTEALSLFSAMKFLPLVTVWSIVSILSGGALAISIRTRGRSLCELLRRRAHGVTRSGWAMTGSTVFVCLVTFVVALVAPPNNWDSMAYHMPRVVMWIQQESVRHYPTANLQQIFQMPLAEFAILHLQCLSGSDRLANIVQWASLLASANLVSLIIRELTGSRRSQHLGAVLAVTIPMAILQSSSTQNDLVAAAFCLAFAFFLLRLRRRRDWWSAFFGGAAFGLALLTKGTAYIYCSCIGGALAVYILCRARSFSSRKKLFVRLACAAVFGILLNLGHYHRNHRLFGHPLSDQTARFRNERFTPSIVSDNLIRNIGVHLGTPSKSFNRGVERMIRALLMGKAGNPASSFEGRPFVVKWIRHEDMAGNFLHLLLLVAGILMLPFIRRWLGWRIGVYGILLVMIVLLYCALLKWQPWASRLHTPFFLLAVPLPALFLGRIKRGRFALLVSVVFLCFSVSYLFRNVTRSLDVKETPASIIRQDRLTLYFVNRPDLQQQYIRAVDLLSSRHEGTVGLITGGNDWEYPLWVLAERFGGQISYRHIGVGNETAQLTPARRAPPRFVISTQPLDMPGDTIKVDGESYILIDRMKDLMVLELISGLDQTESTVP